MLVTPSQVAPRRRGRASGRGAVPESVGLDDRHHGGSVIAGDPAGVLGDRPPASIRSAAPAYMPSR